MKLLFHIGLNKAGSTYLQDVFSFNHQALFHAGILYPNPPTHTTSIGDAQSGNAAQFAVNIGNGEKEKARVFLEDVKKNAILKNLDTILLSTEFMYHILLKKDRADEFKELCDEIGFSQISLLVIFRDPVSHSISAYNHRVGGSQLPGFEIWLKQGYEFYNELSVFLESLSKDKRFKLFLEGYSKTGLFSVAERFLKIENLKKPNKSLANVSINCVESEIVRIIHSKDTILAKFIREKFKELPKEKKKSDSYMKNILEALAISHGDKFKQELQELSDLIGSDKCYETSRNISIPFEKTDPYFILSREQLLILLERPTLLENYQAKSRAFIVKYLPKKVKVFVRSLVR